MPRVPEDKTWMWSVGGAEVGTLDTAGDRSCFLADRPQESVRPNEREIGLLSLSLSLPSFLAEGRRHQSHPPHDVLGTPGDVWKALEDSHPIPKSGSPCSKVKPLPPFPKSGREVLTLELDGTRYSRTVGG